jgi:antitoxin component YwqK of YwqJK toxin-antitoxin module
MFTMSQWHFNISRQNLLHYSKVLIVLLVISYIQIMYVGKTEVPRYENGQPKSYGAYKDGLPEGKWTWWFADGKKMSEGYFSQGKRNGEWTTWFATGRKKSWGKYKDDKLEGSYRKWYGNGVIEFEGSYVMDKLDGEQKYYDAKGNLSKVAHYSNGEKISESATQ